MISNAVQALDDPARLAALQRLALLDSPTEIAFDRLTKLANKILKAPVSLVSLVSDDRQFFKSMVGLADPWASLRGTPLSHSFCQYVVTSGAPLVVSDARQDAQLKDNLAIRDLNVIGYLGMPLEFSDGNRLGSFCVIDTEPRIWTDYEIEVVRELAASVMTEIELRGELIAHAEADKKLQVAYGELEKRNQQLSRVTEFCRSTVDHMYNTLQRGASKEEMTQYLSSVQQKLDYLA